MVRFNNMDKSCLYCGSSWHLLGHHVSWSETNSSASNPNTITLMWGQFDVGVAEQRPPRLRHAYRSVGQKMTHDQILEVPHELWRNHSGAAAALPGASPCRSDVLLID